MASRDGNRPRVKESAGEEMVERAGGRHSG